MQLLENSSGPWGRACSFLPTVTSFPDPDFATAWMNAGSPPFAPEIKLKDAPKQKEDTALLQTLLWTLPSHYYANTIGGPKSVSQSPASTALARASFMPVIPTPTAPTAEQTTTPSISHMQTAASAFSVQAISPVLQS